MNKYKKKKKRRVVPVVIRIQNSWNERRKKKHIQQNKYYHILLSISPFRNRYDWCRQLKWIHADHSLSKMFGNFFFSIWHRRPLWTIPFELLCDLRPTRQTNGTSSDQYKWKTPSENLWYIIMWMLTIVIKKCPLNALKNEMIS